MAATTLVGVAAELQKRKGVIDDASGNLVVPTTPAPAGGIAGSGKAANVKAIKEKAKLDTEVKKVGVDAIRAEIARKKAERDLRKKKRLEAEAAHNAAVKAAASN